MLLLYSSAANFHSSCTPIISLLLLEMEKQKLSRVVIMSFVLRIVYLLSMKNYYLDFLNVPLAHKHFPYLLQVYWKSFSSSLPLPCKILPIFQLKMDVLRFSLIVLSTFCNSHLVCFQGADGMQMHFR